MELIPKTLVAGVTVVPSAPNRPLVSPERINRIWTELMPRYGFTALQMAPNQQAANFAAATPEDGLTINPPILQVRETIRTSPQETHRRAADMLRTSVRHLDGPQLFQFGVRHVYDAPMPDNDARSFLLNRVLGRGGADIEDLSEGADTWGGVKYVLTRSAPEALVYTLIVEPSQAEEMRSLYIDLDAQFPGPVNLDVAESRCGTAQAYLTGTINRYLDRLLEMR